MAGKRSELAQARWWPGAVALGLAALIPASLGGSWLNHGGLAALSVAALVALGLAAPAARAEVRAGSKRERGPHRADRIATALAEVVALTLIGALSAPLVAQAGWSGQPIALGAWILIGLAARRFGGFPAAALALGAVLLGIGGGLLAVTQAPPWTLLEPHWGSWTAWLPGSLAIGLLMAPLGVGQWGAGPAVPPGGARVAFATTGLALLLAVGSSLRAGARFEASLGDPAVDPVGQLVIGLAAAAAGCAVVSRPETGARWSRVGLGALATLWFSGPAAGALPLFLATVIPAGMGIVLLRVAQVSQAGDRLLAGLAAGVAFVAALGAPQSFPDSMRAAAALGLTLVAMFWYVATRAVRVR